MNPKNQCQHFKICSGCHYLDKNYQEELDLKKNLIYQIFSKFKGVKIAPIIPSPLSENYRNKIQVPFGTRKIKGKNHLVLGLFDKDSKFVVDQRECQIQSPDLTSLLLSVKDWAKKEKLSVYNPRRRNGLLRYLVARKSNSTNEVLLALVTTEERFPYQKESSKRLNQLINSNWKSIGSKAKLVGILQNFNSQNTNMALGKETDIWWGRNYIKERILEYDFRVGIDTFLQTNPFALIPLYERALKELNPNETIIDAYCGIGTTSLFFSKKSKNIIGIEENPAAIKAGIEAIRTNKIKNIKLRKGSVSDILPQIINSNIDTMVLDPPRIGIGFEVIQSILFSNLKKLVYISCDPYTLFEDVRALNNKYNLEMIIPVDMFPRTRHIELIAIMNQKD